MIATVALLAGVMLYGMPLVRLIDRRLRGYAFAGAAFLIGAGAAALHLFLLGVIGINWTRTSVLLAIVPLLVLACTMLWKRGPAAVPPREGVAASALDLLWVLPIIAYAIFATSVALYEWDFVGIWGLKGRWLYELGGIEWTFMRTTSARADYPPLVPLLFDFVAVVTGGWRDGPIALLHVGFCAAVVMIARGLLRDEIGSHSAAAAGTLAIVIPSLNLWIGLAETFVMAYGSAGLLFVRRGIRDRNRGAMALGAILLALAAWSKNEGLALAAVAAVAVLAATYQIRDVLALWPAALVLAPWIVTRSILQVSTDFMQGGVFNRVLERLRAPGEVIRALIAAPPDQPFFWVVGLLIIAVYARTALTRERFLTLAVLMQLGLMVAQALATPWDLGAHVSLTLNRLPHQLAPAFGFLAVVLVARSWRGGAGNARAERR